MTVIVREPAEEIEGVKPEVAQAFKKMLEGGRRYFGSSGASLTHQVSNPKYADSGIDSGAAKVGLEGERDTTTFLREWMKNHPSAVLIDSVHVRGAGKEEVDEETGMIEGGDTDHILIFGSEVILIDTKRWKKKSTYQVDESGEVLRANKSFPGGKVRAAAASKLWLNYLMPGAKVTTTVVINSEEITVLRTRPWYTNRFRLVEIGRLEEFLNSRVEHMAKADKTEIDTSLVAQVAVGCVKPYDHYERVFAMDSLRDFR